MPQIGDIEKQLGITQERMDKAIDPLMQSLMKSGSKATEALFAVEGSKDLTQTEKLFMAYHIGRLTEGNRINKAARGMAKKIGLLG